MAMPGTMQDPMKPVKDMLKDIERKIDELPKKGNDNIDTEINGIKDDISNISKSLTEIVNYIKSDSDEVREQKQREMEQNIINGVNTRLGNVSDSISAFDKGLGQRLDNIHFKTSLREDDANLLRRVSTTLAATNMNGRVTEIEESIKKTGDAEVKRVGQAGKDMLAEVQNGKEELRGEAHKGVKNVQSASYEAAERVRGAANWLKNLYKNKVWWISGAIALWAILIGIAIWMINRGYETKAAAEQSLRNANTVIEHMPDYRYWLIYKAKNPQKSAEFQKEMDELYGSKLYKESIN